MCIVRFSNACQRLMLKLINCFPNHQLSKKNGDAIEHSYDTVRILGYGAKQHQTIQRPKYQETIQVSLFLPLPPSLSSQLFLHCIIILTCLYIHFNAELKHIFTICNSGYESVRNYFTHLAKYYIWIKRWRQPQCVLVATKLFSHWFWWSKQPRRKKWKKIPENGKIERKKKKECCMLCTVHHNDKIFLCNVILILISYFVLSITKVYHPLLNWWILIN